MQNIIVSGGAGFIGSHLVDKLVEQGLNVTVLDNLSTGKKTNINQKAKFIKMKKHTKIYIKGMGYTDTDCIESEISGLYTADLHHIVSRDHGGEDILENLIVLTREEHLEFGDKKQHMHFLFKKHYNFLIKKKVKFNVDFFIDMFDKYFDKSVI